MTNDETIGNSKLMATLERDCKGMGWTFVICTFGLPAWLLIRAWSFSHFHVLDKVACR
jgi:hypothetical protein